jgi:YbbR domain-containing protein
LLSVLGKNLPLKVLSIILAIFLWFFISRGQGGEEMEISLGVPVELHNLPPEMEVTRGPVERVDVRMSGPRRVVSRVSQLGITIPLDLMGAAEGETTFELFTSDINVPERVTVTRVSPSSVDVLLERTVKKKVNIVLLVEGTPMSGFRALEPVVTPNVMEIKGPRSQIKGIKALKAIPVSVEGADEEVSGETSVILPEEGTVRAVNRSSVQYRIPILELEAKNP